MRLKRWIIGGMGAVGLVIASLGTYFVVKSIIVQGLVADAMETAREDNWKQAVERLERARGSYFERDFLSGLFSHATDPNPKVRRQAASVIRWFSNLESMSEFVLRMDQLLDDPDPEVREQILFALGRFSEHQELPLSTKSRMSMVARDFMIHPTKVAMMSYYADWLQNGDIPQLELELITKSGSRQREDVKQALRGLLALSQKGKLSGTGRKLLLKHLEDQRDPS